MLHRVLCPLCGVSEPPSFPDGGEGTCVCDAGTFYPPLRERVLVDAGGFVAPDAVIPQRMCTYDVPGHSCACDPSSYLYCLLASPPADLVVGRILPQPFVAVGGTRGSNGRRGADSKTVVDCLGTQPPPYRPTSYDIWPHSPKGAQTKWAAIGVCGTKWMAGPCPGPTGVETAYHSRAPP